MLNESIFRTVMCLLLYALLETLTRCTQTKVHTIVDYMSLANSVDSHKQAEQTKDGLTGDDIKRWIRFSLVLHCFFDVAKRHHCLQP